MGVLDQMEWLLEELCVAFVAEENLAVDRINQTIFSLRDQLDDLRADQEEMSPVPDQLADVAAECAAANDQLWDCLDRVEKWLHEPTLDALLAIESDFRAAEERLERIEVMADDVEEVWRCPSSGSEIYST